LYLKLTVDFASRPSKKINPYAEKGLFGWRQKNLARSPLPGILGVSEHTPRRSADGTANNGMDGEFGREVQLRW
jgi:hypothetical protein